MSILKSVPVICERMAALRIGSTAPIASIASGTTLRWAFATITGMAPPPPPRPPFPAPPPPPAPVVAWDFSPQPPRISAVASATRQRQVRREKDREVIGAEKGTWSGKAATGLDLCGRQAVCQRHRARREELDNGSTWLTIRCGRKERLQGPGERSVIPQRFPC